MSPQKGNGLDAANDQPAKTQSKDTGNFFAFAGTDNVRHLRVIAALLKEPRRREDIDRIAGCSNGPQLIASLRELGLAVPCERISFIDRDGYRCNPSVYHMTPDDRQKIHHWEKQQGAV